MTKVLLCQLDGSFPNHALMRVSAHHKALGDEVELRHIGNVKAVERGLFDDFGQVYASAIFEWSRPVAKRLKEIYPHAHVGGPGLDIVPNDGGLVNISARKAEAEVSRLETVGITTMAKDYSFWPAFTPSIGFTMRGCRMGCGFCKVPVIEGKAHAAELVHEIWRGGDKPKHLILWDNDTFGVKGWKHVFTEIREGGYRVSFNQGVNARLMNEENAEWLAAAPCYTPRFNQRRWYTAWDNRNDEEILFRGLRYLTKYGVNPANIMVYMLIGYWPGETAVDREYRRAKLRDFGCDPYPMPFRRTPELVGFQRWVVPGYDKRVKWSDWKANGYRPEGLGVTVSAPLFEAVA